MKKCRMGYEMYADGRPLAERIKAELPGLKVDKMDRSQKRRALKYINEKKHTMAAEAIATRFTTPDFFPSRKPELKLPPLPTPTRAEKKPGFLRRMFGKIRGGM